MTDTPASSSRWMLVLLISVAGNTTVHGPLASQEPGVLSGRVLDAGTGSPLVMSRVTLVTGSRGFFPSDMPENDAVSGTRVRLTDESGRYRFENVSPGYYRILVRRIGFRPTTIDLHLAGPDGLDLSVGLVVAPIRLEPLETREAPRGLFEPEPNRRDRSVVERWRQDAFAATDVRVIGQTDVDHAVTLGERDVLRALRRLPGVSARDDWTAQPWVRGATSGQTRVYFDGVPVFNPVLSGGLNASIDPDALSTVFLHPGVRPPALSEGAAAVVDLRSRTAPGLGDLSGRISFSRTRVGGSFARRWSGGRFGTVLTGSGSWNEETRRLARTDDGTISEIPNNFTVVVFRGDAIVTERITLETSFMWQRDRIDGYLEGGPANNKANWGSALGRATLHFPVGSGSFRQTVAVTSFSTHVRQIEPRVPLAAFDEFPTQEPTDNSLRYVLISGEWTDAAPETVGLRWRAGYELGHYDVTYRGAPPTPYSIPTYLYTLEMSESVALARLWAERWWRPGDAWTIRTGIRVEQYVQDEGTFAEPYFAIRHDVSDRIRFSFTSARHVQYAQPLAPSGTLFGPALSSGPVWLLAPTVGRALVSDVSTLGGEAWFGDDWLGTAHIYWRETDGIAIPDPTPGSSDDDPFLVHASSDAWGSEVSLRKLTGSWTGSFAYTLGVTTYSASRLEFPAPTDRRHVLDMVVSTELPNPVADGRVVVSAAANVASGAPYTRIHPGWYDCRNYQPGGHCEAVVPTMTEEPNAERAPWTSGVNLRVEWSRGFNGWRLGAHAQLHNALNMPRPMVYAVDETSCRRQTLEDAFCGPAQDTFVPGMRRHAELGLRVIF